MNRDAAALTEIYDPAWDLHGHCRFLMRQGHATSRLASLATELACFRTKYFELVYGHA